MVGRNASLHDELRIKANIWENLLPNVGSKINLSSAHERKKVIVGAKGGGACHLSGLREDRMLYQP